MSQLNVITRSNNPDMIYYDLAIKNFQSTTKESQHLKFNEIRNTPFVPVAEDYYLSIVRFQLDTYSLPTFKADIQPNQNDPNLMIQSVTLEYQANALAAPITVGPVYLVWDPFYKNISVPPAPSTQSNGQQVNSDYYYTYSFGHVISMCNTALKTAMAQLKLLVLPLAGVGDPFMEWDETESIAKIYAEVGYFNRSTFPNIKIFFNRPMFALFNSFPAYRNDINAPNNKVYDIILDSNNGINLIRNPAVYNNAYLIEQKQEYSTIANWTPVSSIVFTSVTLPIVPNQLSAPLVVSDNEIVPLGNANSNFAQVITDLSTDEMVFKPNLLYNPTAEYRRIDMRTNQPLTNLDINVYWRDKRGTLNEFLLWSGCSCSIKLLFEKKRRN